MNSQCSMQAKMANQTAIYDDLSLLIQIYKRIFVQAELLIINLQQGNQYSFYIGKIQQNIQELRELSLKYPIETLALPIEKQYLQIYKSTFQRFVCRLIQIIYLYKMKYQNVQKTYAVNSFITCIKEIQILIRKYQQEKLFSKIIKSTQHIFNKLCRNCEGNIKVNGKDFKNHLYQNKNHSIQNINQNIKQEQQKLCHIRLMKLNQKQQKYQQKEEKFGSPERKFIVPIASFNLMQLHKRFQTLKYLDLDFNYFKSNFYEAKTNYNDFYKSFVQRNQPIQYIINTYHDDFQLYMKKKSYKSTKRHKRMKSFKSNEIFEFQNQQKAKKDKKDTLLIKRNKINHTFDEKQLKEKAINMTSIRQRQFINQFDSTKMSYKMKHIYITLSHKQSLKRQKRLFLGKDPEVNKTLLNIQNKYQASPCWKKNDKIKTQNNRGMQQEPYYKDQEMNSQIFTSPTKTQHMKAKYLQINCLAKVSSFSNTKSKFLIAGLNPKLPIKNNNRKDHQKQKLENSFKKI